MTVIIKHAIGEGGSVQNMGNRTVILLSGLFLSCRYSKLLSIPFGKGKAEQESSSCKVSCRLNHIIVFRLT